MDIIKLMLIACCLFALLLGNGAVIYSVFNGHFEIEFLQIIAIDAVIFAVIAWKLHKKHKESRRAERAYKREEERTRKSWNQDERMREIEGVVRQWICALFSINGARLDVELNGIFLNNPQLKYGHYYEVQKEDWFIRKDKLDTVVDLIEEHLQRKRMGIELNNVWYCSRCGSMNFEKDSQCCVCLNNRNGSNNV